jgi:hypothetical protein
MEFPVVDRADPVDVVPENPDTQSKVTVTLTAQAEDRPHHTGRNRMAILRKLGWARDCFT